MMNADFDAITALHTALRSIQQRPQEQATALAVFCYTDPAILNYEIEQLLRNEWLCLGRADEIPNPGDYFTTLLLDEPLLIVRGDDNQIRVLSNICRHRNMLVAESCGNRERFLCPYHAWSYGRDGRLLFDSRMPKSALSDTTRAGLPALKHELWQGFIYVNLSGTAEPLAPRLQGLDAILNNYHTDEMHHIFVTEEVWRVNWKYLVVSQSPSLLVYMCLQPQSVDAVKIRWGGQPVMKII